MNFPNYIDKDLSVDVEITTTINNKSKIQQSINNEFTINQNN
jgi:hypothetical protein